MASTQRLIPPLLAIGAGVGIAYYTLGPGLKEYNSPPAVPQERKPEQQSQSSSTHSSSSNFPQDAPRPFEPVQQVAGGFEYTSKPPDTFGDEPSSIGGTGVGNPEKKRARWW